MGRENSVPHTIYELPAERARPMYSKRRRMLLVMVAYGGSSLFSSPWILTGALSVSVYLLCTFLLFRSHWTQIGDWNKILWKLQTNDNTTVIYSFRKTFFLKKDVVQQVPVSKLELLRVRKEEQYLYLKIDGTLVRLAKQGILDAPALIRILKKSRI